MTQNLHPATKQITDLLDENQCWYETFEHEPVRTSEEAAQIRTDYELHHGAKAIILRVKKSNADKFFAMLVFPADRQFDKAKVKGYFEVKDIRFATEMRSVSSLSGTPGSMSIASAHATSSASAIW